MRHCTIKGIFVVTISSFLLTGCPPIVNLKLANETGKSLYVLAITSDYKQAEVKSGKSAIVPYNYVCFRIRTGDEVFEYKPVEPPGLFFEKGGIFSTTINARFSLSHQMQFVNKNQDKNDVITLESGCGPK